MAGVSNGVKTIESFRRPPWEPVANCDWLTSKLEVAICDLKFVTASERT
jgi:hypothetical protein